MNEHRLKLGIVAGVAGTLLTGFGVERAQAPERARLEYVRHVESANALSRARREGFEEAVCLADKYSAIRPLSEDRFVPSELGEIYFTQLERCPINVVVDDEAMRWQVWIPTESQEH